MKNFIAVVLVFVFGSNGDLAQTTSAPILQRINISNTASPVAGMTDALKATGVYSDGSTADLTTSVTWASSNTSIFTVSASGVVTGLVQGVANVTATFLAPGSNAAIVGTFSETILPPTPVNLAIAFATNGLQSIYKNASTFVQAVVHFSNSTSQLVSSWVNWVVTPVSNNGMASIAVDHREHGQHDGHNTWCALGLGFLFGTHQQPLESDHQLAATHWSQS